MTAGIEAHKPIKPMIKEGEMNVRILGISALVAVALTVLSMRGTMGVTNEKTIQIAPVTESAAPASEGFQLLAKVERVPTDSGDSLVLKLTMKNVTTETLRLIKTVPEKLYQVTVTNDRGEPLPLTEYGKRRREAVPGARIVLRVGPGEEVQQEIPLDKMYDLTGKGTYSLTVKRNVLKRQGEGFAEVVSNTVKFTVGG